MEIQESQAWFQNIQKQKFVILLALKMPAFVDA